MENGISKKLSRYLVAVCAIVGMTAVATTASIRNEKGAEPESVPGELIVKMKDGDNKASRLAMVSAIEKSLGAGAVQEVEDFQTDRQLKLVRLGKNKARSIKSAIKAVQSEPGVLYAEPNYVVRAFNAGLPNDAEFEKLWGLNNTGQQDSQRNAGKPGADINVLPLWAQGITGSKDIVVAVIDTGIAWNHPDLKDNLYTNPGEIPGNGIDDDGNGFIDDVHGYSFSGTPSPNSNDDHNHGTHCAGTVGAKGNNGIGVAGVNWNVTLMPIKFLSASGSGSTQGAIESVNYATKMGVHVMSNSWGGGGFSQALKEAIERAHAAGILFVAAAGNDGSNNDSRAVYPANYDVPNVLSVAAIHNRDGLASFSNWGARMVHVAAPGVNVHSTVKSGGYASYSGTSMACPHVAGVAALLMAANPSWTFAEVKDRLIRTSEPVSALRRKVVAGGRVNAYNAFMGVTPPSSEPDESLWRDEIKTLESDHPYGHNLNQTWTISSPGARFMRIYFEKIDTEANYDKVSVETPAGEKIEELTGRLDGYMTDYLTGDTAVIRLRTDGSVNSWGFKISKIQVIRE